MDVIILCIANTRYSFGGDEYIFVELSEEMDLGTNFKVMGITNELKKRNIPGVVSIYPANVSYMVRFDPDTVDGAWLIETLKQIERLFSDLKDLSISSRIINIPIYFEDPWTLEALMKFRERHQEPELTDLEFATKVNDFETTDQFIDYITRKPYLVTMVSVMPGIPWCFQLTSQGEKRIEVPKYKSPRTFTPKSAFGFGGAFAVVYPIEAAGGYQIFGRAPAPIFDEEQKLPDFKHSLSLLRQGDIVKFSCIDRKEYDSITDEVNNGAYLYNIQDYCYNPNDALECMDSFIDAIERRVNS